MHRLQIGDAEQCAINAPLHLRMLPGVIRGDAGCRAFEHVAVARAGRGAAELLRQEVRERAVYELSVSFGWTILERRLLIAAAGDQHVLIGEWHPAARTTLAP